MGSEDSPADSLLLWYHGGESVVGRLFRHAPSPSGPHLFCQLVLVFSRCLLQFCDARLLLLHHGAQVLNAIVIWQLIFGHLQAAVQSRVRENRLFNRTCVLTASSVTEPAELSAAHTTNNLSSLLSSLSSPKHAPGPTY